MSNGKWRYAILYPGSPGLWYEGGKQQQVWEPVDKHGQWDAYIQEQLDRAGADGWELVGMESRGGSESTKYVFKRPR